MASNMSDDQPALTIYNQNFFVARERLPLDLRAGVNRVEYAGIAAHLDHRLARIAGHEQNRHGAVLAIGIAPDGTRQREAALRGQPSIAQQDVDLLIVEPATIEKFFECFARTGVNTPGTMLLRWKAVEAGFKESLRKLRMNGR